MVTAARGLGAVRDAKFMLYCALVPSKFDPTELLKVTPGPVRW